MSFFLALGTIAIWAFAMALAYWLYQVMSLRYRLGRDALTILCAGSRYLVPLDRIQEVQNGKDLAGQLQPPLVSLAGHWIGRGKTKEGSEVLFLATRPLSEQVLLKTPVRGYVLSPQNASAFLLALRARQNLGSLHNRSEEAVLAPWLSLAVWRDWLEQGLFALAALANLILFLYVFLIIPRLPVVIPFHYNAWGVVDRIEPREALLYLPGIGLLVLGLNYLLGVVFHRREPLASYFLAATTFVVQILLAVAVVNITS